MLFLFLGVDIHASLLPDLLVFQTSRLDVVMRLEATPVFLQPSAEPRTII